MTPNRKTTETWLRQHVQRDRLRDVSQKKRLEKIVFDDPVRCPFVIQTQQLIEREVSAEISERASTGQKQRVTTPSRAECRDILSKKIERLSLLFWKSPLRHSRHAPERLIDLIFRASDTELLLFRIDYPAAGLPELENIAKGGISTNSLLRHGHFKIASSLLAKDTMQPKVLAGYLSAIPAQDSDLTERIRKEMPAKKKSLSPSRIKQEVYKRLTVQSRKATMIAHALPRWDAAESFPLARRRTLYGPPANLVQSWEEEIRDEVLGHHQRIRDWYRVELERAAELFCMRVAFLPRYQSAFETYAARIFGATLSQEDFESLRDFCGSCAYSLPEPLWITAEECSEAFAQEIYPGSVFLTVHERRASKREHEVKFSIGGTLDGTDPVIAEFEDGTRLVARGGEAIYEANS